MGMGRGPSLNIIIIIILDRQHNTITSRAHTGGTSSSTRIMQRQAPLSLLFAAAAALLAGAQEPPIIPAREGPPLPWAASAEAEGFDSRTLAGVGPKIQKMIDDKAIPGAVAMGARDGKLVLNVTAGGGAFSWAEGEPIVRLFSMSKPLVSILALALVDKGLLSLDDSIGKHLPELASPVIYNGLDAFGNFKTDRPASRCATVRELMTHTAGFSYGFNAKNPVDRAYMLAGFADMKDLPGSDAFIRALKDIPLIAEPNTTWQYSVSFDVLGVILERVASRPLDAILREYLTEPLQLPDTDFYVPQWKAKRLPAMEVELNDAPYSLQPINEHYRPSFFSSGAGIYSTASDYLRVAQMLLNGGELDGVRILSEASVQAMTMNQLPPSAMPFHLGGFQGFAFGLGVAVTSEAEASPNRPLGEVSWGGYAGTQWFASPATKTIVVTMSQHAPIDGKLSAAVKSYFFRALRKGGGMPPVSADPSDSDRAPLLRGSKAN